MTVGNSLISEEVEFSVELSESEMDSPPMVPPIVPYDTRASSHSTSISVAAEDIIGTNNRDDSRTASVALMACCGRT